MSWFRAANPLPKAGRSRWTCNTCDVSFTGLSDEPCWFCGRTVDVTPATHRTSCTPPPRSPMVTHLEENY